MPFSKFVAKRRPLHRFSLRLARQPDAGQLDGFFFDLAGPIRKSRIREIRKAIGHGEVVVAVSSDSGTQRRRDNLLGFVHGIIHNDPISAGPLLYVTALFVKENYRGRGIGTSLLDFIIRRSVRHSSIEGVEVPTARRQASRLYERLGFKQFKDDFGEKLLQLDTREWKVHRKLWRRHTD